MEIGFYHPDRGYWQTVSEPSAEIIGTYPTGTIQIPLKPGENYVWEDGDWVYREPSGPTLEEMRASLPPISRRQLRLTLVRNGISLDQVAAMIEALPEGLVREEAKIEWEDAGQFERLHPTLLLIASGLGLTDAQVDDLWRDALGV